MPIPVAPTQASVNTTSAQVLPATPTRQGAVFQNLSQMATISLGLGAPAKLNNGITLVPGGIWTMDPNTVTTMAIFAISDVANAVLSIQEFV